MYGVGAMAFVLFLSTLVGLPVLPQLSEELGAGPVVIPIMVSSALATVVVPQFFTGALADRYSRRTLVLAGALLGAVSSLLCVVATNWEQLLAFRVLGGVADAVAMPALLAITATIGTKQPGKFFGILRSSQGMSFFVGPLVGGALSLASLRMPFLVDGLLSLLAFAVAIVLLRGTDRVEPSAGISVFRGLRMTFSSRRVYLYLLLGISGMFAFAVLYGFVPTKSRILGLEAWQIGVILGGGALIHSIMSYATGALSDRYGRKAFVVVSQVLVVGGVTGIILSDGFAGMLVSYGVFCIGETMTLLLSFVYASETFDVRHMGASMAAFDAVLDLSLLIGPLLAVSIYQSTGLTTPVFAMAVVPAALAFFAAAAWLPRR